MTDYAKMKNDELQALLKQRSLPHTGKKADMVARLQEADKKTADKPETKTTTAPVAAEDEIDWDDDAGDATKPEKATEEAAPAPATEEKKAEIATPAADTKAENTEAKADTATDNNTKTAEATNATTEAPKEEVAKAEEKEKTPVDFSSGLATTTIEEELEKRRARAKKFGLPEADPAADEAMKKLERAKKFGETGGPRGLNEALPERSRKRGREGGDENGRGKFRRGEGRKGEDRRGEKGGEKRNDSKKKAPEKIEKPQRTQRMQKSGGAPTWMSEADKAKAEARKAKFAAAS